MSEHDNAAAATGSSAQEEQVVDRWGARRPPARTNHTHQAPVYLTITNSVTAARVFFYVPAPSQPSPKRTPPRKTSTTART